jgi:hypothetical protein
MAEPARLRNIRCRANQRVHSKHAAETRGA